MAGRVRSLSSLSGQASCWPRIAEIPLQGLKSAEAFSFALVLGSLGSLSMMNEGGLVSFRKGILCVQRTGRNGRNRESRGTALRNTNDCRLWGKCGPRLGAHTRSGPNTEGG